MSDKIFVTYKRNAAHSPMYGYAPIKDLSLRETFDCGQCFRWRELEDGSYIGIAGSHIAKISYDPKKKFLHIEELSSDTNPADATEFWMEYLDLNRDYGAIKRKLSKDDPIMKEAILSGKGIRILKQDLWDTIVLFIISQNNNIARIKGCIENLAFNFGDEIELKACRDDEKFLDIYNLKPYRIPTAKKLACLTEKDLEPVKLGYRARYLIETGKWVSENGLPKTMDELNALTGVGPKVASCIGLFGMGIMDSFPIDVWVKRVMNRLYGLDERDIKGMAEFAREKFGELGGYAQQYLFYHIRENIEKIDAKK